MPLEGYKLNQLITEHAKKISLPLFHGASPGRWARRSADPARPIFLGGAFMTPNAHLANMYCADWSARVDKTEYIQRIIDDIFDLGDPEEILGFGLVMENEDGFVRGPSADATYVLKNWSRFEISHYLVRRNIYSHHDYPTGAIVYPLRLRDIRVRFIDCMGGHFDDLDGVTVGMPGHRFTTDGVVKLLSGTCDAIWFENITDPVHITMTDPGDVVFVYAPSSLEFSLSGDSPADLK